MEVTDSNKNTSLLYHGVNYDCKMFLVQKAELFSKYIAVVSYDRKMFIAPEQFSSEKSFI